jgi:hypothetical protein
MMERKDSMQKIREEKEKWEKNTLKPALDRFKLKKAPTTFYTPLDDGEGFDFLNKVGFPGQYPFTAGTFPTFPYRTGEKGSGAIAQAPGLVRAGRYSGYGSAEDTRNYYMHMKKLGQKAGPNIAFDLPTQCGYDSDNPMAMGEVGRVGVAVDTLRDMEIIFEAFSGENDIDRTASNFTINAPANIIMAMYLALADKRKIPWEKLRATPQNDILKEFVARGTYIFSPRHSMRMFRDSLVFFTKHLPNVNVISMGGFHIREAGATREQDLAFSLAIGAAYLQEGVNAGLAVDDFAPRFSFNAFGGSMEFFKEVAFHRAYDGWNNMPMVGGEIQNPQKSIPLSLIIGVGGVMLIYTLANVAYVYALPFGELLNANSKLHPEGLPAATKAASSFLGTSGTVILSTAFFISAMGALNGSVLTSSRIPYAMATENMMPRFLAAVHPRSHVPVRSALIQGGWATVLAISGTFDQITDYVVFAGWIFYGLASISLLIFRFKFPDAPRGYRVLAYPWLPLVFAILAVALLINTLMTSPKESLTGLVFIASGVPIFFWMRRSRKTAVTNPAK